MCAVMTGTPAHSETIQEADEQKPVSATTIDWLNGWEKLTTSDGSSLTVAIGSLYDLTETFETGENILTKTICDTTTGAITNKNFLISLKNGGIIGSGDTSYATTVKGINGGTFSVEVYYDSSTLLSQYTSDTATTDTISGTFYNLEKRGIANTDSSATFGNVDADFINTHFNASNNSNTAAVVSAYGGAIYNVGIIGDVTGNFISTYAKSTRRSNGRIAAGAASAGGAIYNGTNGTIGDITGDFINNHAESLVVVAARRSYSYGGAIFNSGTASNITGDFIGNYVLATKSYNSTLNGYAYGGAIRNSGTVNNITGDFIGNYASATNTVSSSGNSLSASGGAIHNSGTVSNITGEFIGNYVSTAGGTTGAATGGAIYNSGNISALSGAFLGNSAGTDGGAIYNDSSDTATGVISALSGTFSGNSAGSGGG